MKHKLLSGFLAVLCLVFTLVACNKETDPSKTAATDIEVAAHSDDESRVSGEMDAVAADMNVALESDNSFSGNASMVAQLVCDATITMNKTSDPMTITLTYNGANCGGTRKRTGSVVLSMAKAVKWKDTGAAITVTYNNLKITRTKDNQSITINGSHIFTNVSGGLLINLATLGSITHTITSDNMSITFADGTQRTWHVARQHVFTYDNGVIVTINGLHTEGNIEHVAEWGLNRFGNSFNTAITGLLVVKQDCDFRITSGEVTHTTSEYTAVVTFGLDVAGVATGCPGTGHYYYKVGFTRQNGKHFEIILPY